MGSELVSLAKQARDLSLRENQVEKEQLFPIPTLNQENTRFMVHDHKAVRAGDHYDMRIAMGGKAYSWATRYGFPEEGKPRVWYLQPPHSLPYMGFEGHIPKGQKGHGDVSIHFDDHATVTSNPDRVDFAINKDPYKGQYVMMNQGNGNWFVLKKKDRIKTSSEIRSWPPPVPEHYKPQLDYNTRCGLMLKEMGLNQVGNLDPFEVWTVKEGAARILFDSEFNGVSHGFESHWIPRHIILAEEGVGSDRIKTAHQDADKLSQIFKGKNSVKSEEIEKLNEEKEDKGETLSVILKIPTHKPYLKNLQSQLRKTYDHLEQFEEKFHVTLLYTTGLTVEAVKEALPEVKKAVAGHCFPLSLGPISHWTNAKGEGVIFLKVNKSPLVALNKKLQEIAKKHGGKLTYPEYKPHVTLCYRSTGLEAKDLNKLKRFDASFGVHATSSDIEVTQKSGDGWKKLAEEWGSFSKYSEEGNWNKVLIETPDVKLTKKDIYDYYKNPKVQKGLMQDILQHNGTVMLKQTPEAGKSFFRRKKDNGAAIKILNHDELNSYLDKRVTEFHPVIDKVTPRIWIDLDPKAPFPWERTKNIASSIATLMERKPEVKSVQIRFSGGSGLHIIGELHKSVEVEKAKAMADRIAKSFETSDQKLGLARAGELRLDTSTLKQGGSLRALYSLNSETGKPCIPVTHSSLTKLEPNSVNIEYMTSGKYK